MMTPRIRLGCLQLAVELAKTANAFDQHARIIELAAKFEAYCAGDAKASEDPARYETHSIAGAKVTIPTKKR